MQTIRIAHIEVKNGEKNGKPWTKYTITGEDKSTLSTFEKNAASLKAGDSIEAEVEVQGKYTNLKSFKVLGGGSSLPPPVTQLKVAPLPIAGRSTDDRIAEQVAVKAIVELASYKVIDPNHPLVVAVKSWCSDKLRGYLSMFPIDTPKPSEKPPETQGEGKSGDFGVNMEDLRESFKPIKWTDAVCMSWIESVFKVKRAETLEKTLALLDKTQKEKLCDFVAKAARR